jgi:hypothetical protein
MFGLSEWEKFAKRVMHSNLGLSAHQLELLLLMIKQSKSKNKVELVAYMEENIKETFGPYTSKKFQENRQAQSFFRLLQLVKEKLVDQEEWKS